MFVAGFTKQSLVDFPSKISAVVFTSGCNLRCGFCHNHSLITKETQQDKLIEWNTVLSYLNKYKKWLDGVVITGGEPLLHSKINQMLIDIKKIGLQTKIDTNGSLPDFLRKMLISGNLDYLAMDLKTSWDKYPLLGASENQIKAIQQSIQICSEIMTEVNKNEKGKTSLKIEFRTTMVPSLVSWENFDEIISYIPRNIPLALQQFNPDGVWKEEYIIKAYSDEELEKFQRHAQRELETTLRK